MIAGKIGGMAVVIGGRIRDGAGGGEVLVSRTVKDLLLGRAYAFTSRGQVPLKGLPGEWEIYAVEPAAQDLGALDVRGDVRGGGAASSG